MRHFAPTRFNRRSTRLKGYDYSGPGEYFVTINTHQYLDLFGRVVDGEMWLNECGEIARDEWLRTTQLRPYIYLDEFIIMPNHVQGIIIIQERDRDPTNEDTSISTCTGKARLARTGEERSIALTGSEKSPSSMRKFGMPPKESLHSIVGSYKSAVSKRINFLRGTPSAPVWHRNYHDRIIRGEREFQNIQRYIIENPRRWDEEWRVENHEFLPLPTPK